MKDSESKTSPNWVASVLFLIAGLILLPRYPLSGISLALLSLLFFPPVRLFFYAKTKREIPTIVRSVVALSLTALFWYSGPMTSMHVESATVVINANVELTGIHHLAHSHRLKINEKKMLEHNGKEVLYIPTGRNAVMTIIDHGDPIFSVQESIPPIE